MRDLLRGWPWLVVALITTAIMALLVPTQVGMLLWRLNVVSLFLWLAYWADVVFFRYSRPHTFAHGTLARSLAELRRALLIGCVVLAAGMMVA